MANIPLVKGVGGTKMGPFQRQDPAKEATPSQSHGSVADYDTSHGKSKGDVTQPDGMIDPASDSGPPPERNPASEFDKLGIIMGGGGIPMPRNSSTGLLIGDTAKAAEVPQVKRVTKEGRPPLPVFHVVRNQELDDIVSNCKAFTKRLTQEHLSQMTNDFQRMRLDIAKQFCLHDKAVEKSANAFMDKWKELGAMASEIRKRREDLEKNARNGMEEEANAQAEAARPTSQGELARAATPGAHSISTETDADAEGDGVFEEEDHASSDEVVTQVGSRAVPDFDTMEDQSLMGILHMDESMQTLEASTMQTYASSRNLGSRGTDGTQGTPRSPF